MARTRVSVDPEHYISVPRHRLVDVLVTESGDRGPGVADRFGVETDFDIRDALAKLKQLELVTEDDGVWTACDLDTVLARLDRRWDDHFQFGRSGWLSGT